MLYSEFLKGTRAPETPDTYDQFQIIGQIYEDCEGMTKEEAYRIWKQTYGRELKRRELRQRERLSGCLLMYQSIDHKRFHDLRHTVATVMLEDGEAMNTVQEQLGHYDAGFTASRYGHVTAKMRNSAAVKLGERLEKVRNPEVEDEEDANSVKKEDTVISFQEGRKLKSAACKIK